MTYINMSVSIKQIQTTKHDLKKKKTWKVGLFKTSHFLPVYMYCS